MDTHAVCASHKPDGFTASGRVRRSLVSKALLVASLALACDGTSGGHAADVPTLIPLDSIPLIEPDTAVIGRPVSLSRMSNAEWWVLDRFSASILRFGPDGMFRGRVGRSGDGPGEFESPMRFVEVDSLVVVVDSRLRRVSLFSLSGQYADSAFSIPYTPGDVASGGGSLWITSVGPTDPAVWTWDFRTGASRGFGELPALWREYPFAAALGGPLVVPPGDSPLVTLGFGGIGYLFRVDPRSGQTVDSIAIPAVQRRGIPDEIGEVLASPAASDDISVIYRLHPLPGRRLAVSHLDVTRQGSVFGGEYFLTIVTNEGRPVATDLTVPELTSDAIPTTYFSGDTLHVLTQPLEGLGARSVIRRYLVPAP
jgi:hypothetical protein